MRPSLRRLRTQISVEREMGPKNSKKIRVINNEKNEIKLNCCIESEIQYSNSIWFLTDNKKLLITIINKYISP